MGFCKALSAVRLSLYCCLCREAVCYVLTKQLVIVVQCSTFHPVKVFRRKSLLNTFFMPNLTQCSQWKHLLQISIWRKIIFHVLILLFVLKMVMVWWTSWPLGSLCGVQGVGALQNQSVKPQRPQKMSLPLFIVSLQLEGILDTHCTGLILCSHPANGHDLLEIMWRGLCKILPPSDILKFLRLSLDWSHQLRVKHLNISFGSHTVGDNSWRRKPSLSWLSLDIFLS